MILLKSTITSFVAVAGLSMAPGYAKSPEQTTNPLSSNSVVTSVQNQT